MSLDKADSTGLEKDEILEIFLDENFVPQAFVDILLSTTRAQDMNQLQHTSSSLLARLDYYTRNLTSELEKTIWNLERLSETLPGTWNSSSPKNDLDDEQHDSKTQYNSSLILGASKLEYYLDTLGSAVRSVQTDIRKVDEELDSLDQQYEDETDIIEKSRKLEFAKERLSGVLNLFDQLQSILSISSGAKSKSEIGNISLQDFTISLRTLEETLIESLNEALKNESSKERNLNLLTKIEQFSKLTPIFKGLTLFYEEYSKFSDNVSKASQQYIETKDIEKDFNI